MNSKLLIILIALVSPVLCSAQTAEVIDDVLKSGPTAQVDDSMKPDKKICSGSKKYPVHLSFDDGPDAVVTPQILDMLKKANIKATFLISADKLVQGKPEEIAIRKQLIERMKQEGHTIGSHSFEHIEHANVEKGSRQQVLKNLDRSFKEMDKLGLKKPMPFRFPYGSAWLYDSAKQNQDLANGAMTAIKKAGYFPFHWDIDTEDWSKIKRKALPRASLEQICDSHGGVILMHDVHQWTADNLPVFIESVRDSGHKFVSESEIIKYSEQASKPLNSLQDRLGGPQGCTYRMGHLDHAGPKCDTGTSVKTRQSSGAR